MLVLTTTDKSKEGDSLECEIELSFIEQRRYRAGYNTRHNWSCLLQDQLGISLGSAFSDDRD